MFDDDARGKQDGAPVIPAGRPSPPSILARVAGGAWLVRCDQQAILSNLQAMLLSNSLRACAAPIFNSDYHAHCRDSNASTDAVTAT
ncbi:hypothetical protein [Janthinobacterium sp. PSPC3-1]|uniref:hypothetical protein n=1 Tax=Janthinobacterium sp. PSPC3-1 TaxID=2804653 RepID=UPI003CF1D0BA